MQNSTKYKLLLGLLALTKIDESIAKRKLIANNYDKVFSNIAGIKTLDNNPTLELNYSYYPILINEAEFWFKS